MKRLLIIGAGMATARLLNELSDHGHNWQVTVLGSEQRACYNRIALSSLLAGEASEYDLDLLDEGVTSRPWINVITGETAVSLDTEQRFVHTSSGQRHDYDALVLATGSRASLPAITGIEGAGVQAFRNLDDLEHLRDIASPERRAVVVGGGVLGLEAAAGLLRHGVRTTVLNRGNRVMNRQLDEMAGLYLQRSLQSMGLHFELGVSPRAIIRRNARVCGVELSDGRCLSCDFVLVAAGIEPVCGLAREAGLDCERGIVVNGLMETSCPGVYALGECCEVDGRGFGLVAPIYRQAVVLARVLSGRKTPVFAPADTGVRLKVAGVQVAASGSLPFPDTSRSQLLTDPLRGIYRRLVFHEDRLIGYVLVGDTRHSAWYDELMKSGASPRRLMMFGDMAVDRPAVSREVKHENSA